MERKIYFLILMFFLVTTFAFSQIAIVPTNAVASLNIDGITHHYEILHEAFEAAYSLIPAMPDEITLLSDIILDEPLITPNGKHIRLIPEGGNRTITRGSGNIDFPVIWVSGENSSLTLGTPGMEYELIIDGGFLNIPSIEARAPLITVNGPDSKLIMHDRVVLQNNYNKSTVPPKYYQYGTGVLVRTTDEYPGRPPEFIMKGGIIRGNINDSYHWFSAGGGVFVHTYGIFTMEGGAILGNTATYSGGGIFVYGNCSFTKTGGIIYGINAPEAYRNTVIHGYLDVHGHSVFVSTFESHLQRYRDDTIKESENLTYTGSPSGFGVFGKGEKWHHANTMLYRILFIAAMTIIVISISLAFIMWKKHKLKQAAYIETAMKAAAGTAAEPAVVLSSREKEVFDLLLTDVPVKHIAFNLQLTNSAVNKRITGIYAKLGVKNRFDLIAKYKK